MTKQLRPEEEAARRTIAAHLKVTVEPHDNVPTQRRRPDLRIEYRDRPHAVVEVVRDVDERRAQQHAEVDRIESKWEFAVLTSSWLVILGPQAHMGRLKDELGHILADVASQGLEQVHASGQPVGSPAYRLQALGVRRAWLRPGGTAGTVYFTGSSSWWHGQPPNLVVDWAESMLGRNPDVAAKLLASGYADRQVYLIATMLGEIQIWGMLALPDPDRPDRFILPDRAPALPDGVDSLWVEGGRRVIRWSSPTGWVQVTGR
jgi:hypothetical protein